MPHHIWYDDLLELAGIGLWFVNPLGETTYVNNAMAARLGYTGNEVMSLPLATFTSEEVMADGVRHMKRRRQGIAETSETRLLHRDGTEIPILLSSVPMFGKTGEFLGAAFVLMDISQVKKSEQALGVGEERYRTILENIHDGYYETDLAGYLVYVNDGLVRMFGLESKEKLLGLNMRRFADEKHADRLREIGNLIYCTGNPVPSFEYQITHADGARYDVDISISPIKDNTGQPTGYRGILRDVTERKQTEKLIQGQVKVLEMIATGAPLKDTLEAILCLVEGLSKNTACSILLMDETGQRLTHRAALNLPEDYVRAIDGSAIGPCAGSCGTAAYTGQMVVADIAHDPLWADYRDLALRHELRACWSVPIFSSTRQVLGTFACYYKIKAEPTPAEISRMSTLAHLASIAIERECGEQKLLASEARFRALTERSGEGISLLALDGTVTYTSPVMKTILGYEVDEVVDNPAKERIHPDDTQSLQQLLESLSRQPGMSVATAYRARHKNGSWRWIESTFTNLLDEPNVRAIVVNFCDITERKKAEDALRTSEERFAKAFELNPNPMVILTCPDMRFAHVNQSWLRRYEYRAEEVIGYGAMEINHLPPDEYQKLANLKVWDNVEVRLLTKSGEERIAFMSSELIELDGMVHVLSSSIDITERKQAEDALRASEECFAKAFNASPQPMAILELPSRKYTNVNQALVRSSGWTTEEIVGRTSSEINVWVNPEDSQKVSEMLGKQGFVRDMDTQFRTRSGEVRDFLYSAEQIVFNGQPHILVVANDITERKQAEEALRQNEALLRSVIESNPDWIFVKDRQHLYKLANQSYANSLYLQAQDFIGRNDLELGFPEEQVKGNPEKGIRGFWADDREVLDTGQIKIIEEEQVEINGQTHLFNTFKAPLFASDGSVWGVLGVGRDVTKWKHAETDLRASEERFAKAFNASPQPMAIFEAPGRRIVSVNEAMIRTFGWTMEEMVDHTLADLDIWVDLEQQRYVRDLLASQGSAHNLEIKLRTKSGEVRDFLYSAETINLKDRRHVLVVASDITERKRVELELQESEERYRLLFEHGFAGVLRSTSSGQMIDCNDALARIFGCESRKEFLEHDGRDFYFDHSERQQGVEELRGVDSLRNVERLLKRKDGSPVWTLSNYTVHQRGLNGTLVWDSVVLDITERKLIEQELAQSHEQLRSLSARLEQVREEERTRIAREIHDNLGQVLTGLKLDFSWLDKTLARVKDDDLRGKTGPKLKEIAQLLEETIQTVRDIATELRPGVLDTLGLSAAIDWQSREFARRSGLKCRVNICSEPEGIPAHQSTALFRVFQEILTNIARHAQAKNFSVKIADAGSALTLTVRDDGIGITDEQLRNPTSLGLIGMRERVLGFGGSVRIKGSRQQGTTVTVSLPLGE
ncbi:MAG: PAS domain S-box protein [Acidobacteriota bacterium]